MKVNVNLLEYFWPMRHYLVTTGDLDGKYNIVTISFCMPISKEPPLIAMAIGKNAYSLELIRETREFTINVPTAEIKKQVYYCGYHSGRDIDKFKETGLTSATAKKVVSPIINECIAHMECLVINEVETGDKVLIIGKVIEAYADEDIVKGEKEFKFELGKFPEHIYGDNK